MTIQSISIVLLALACIANSYGLIVVWRRHVNHRHETSISTSMAEGSSLGYVPPLSLSTRVISSEKPSRPDSVTFFSSGTKSEA